jgi:hypothetical protein
VAINIQTDEMLTLSGAAKRLPNRPSASSLWRWCRKGIRGHRLEYIRIGSKIFTTFGALNRFFSVLADSDELSSSVRRPYVKPTTAARDKAIQQAAKVLDNDGI